MPGRAAKPDSEGQTRRRGMCLEDEGLGRGLSRDVTSGHKADVQGGTPREEATAGAKARGSTMQPRGPGPVGPGRPRPGFCFDSSERSSPWRARKAANTWTHPTGQAARTSAWRRPQIESDRTRAGCPGDVCEVARGAGSSCFPSAAAGGISLLTKGCRGLGSAKRGGHARGSH